MSEAEEKRQFNRYKCNCKVSFSNEGSPCDATLLDYSLSGICAVIEGSQQVSIGNVIYLDSTSPDIHDSGVVVWKKKGDEGLIVGIDRIGPISGALNDYRFSDILLGLKEIQATGVLEVNSGKAVKKIFLDGGLVAFATSNLRTESFLFLLLQEGKITKQDFDSFASAEIAPGRSMTAMLVEKGKLKLGESTALLGLQVEKIVKGVFLMDSGNFLFKESPLPADRSLRQPLDPHGLVYRGIMDITDAKLLEKYCPPISGIISLSGKAEKLLSGKSIVEGASREIISLIDGEKDLKALLEASHSPISKALKHVCALYGAGIITYGFAELPADRHFQNDADTRRQHRRFDVGCAVLINNSIKCKGINMSKGGIYVHTGRAFKKGSIVPVSLLLEKKTLTIKTRVQRSEEGVGMGLMFIDLMEWQKSLILDYIDAALDETNVKARKTTVLLVDDSESTRKMKKSKLILDGFDVIEAVNGIEALKVLKERPVGAVVLDLFMDKMDGFKVLSVIRQTPELKNLPVLILSGKSTLDYIEKARALGATAFLPKMTTSPAKLSEMLKKYTGDNED